MGLHGFDAIPLAGTQMRNIRSAVRAFWLEERGAALVEYAVLLVLVAIACIVAAAFLGGQISKMFNKAGTNISGM